MKKLPFYARYPRLWDAWVWLLETVITGNLRRYMHARMGDGFVNEPFSRDADLGTRFPVATRVFDRVQEVIFL